MLDPNKYIDRLRVIVKSVEEMTYKKDWEKFDFLFNRVEDLIKDYDKEFDKTMEEMEREVLEMKKLKKSV